jgi:hypothetical protein
MALFYFNGPWNITARISSFHYFDRLHFICRFDLFKEPGLAGTGNCDFVDLG